MPPLEESRTFSCPYCMAPNLVMIDVTAGEEQQFVQDCEVCCQPIALSIRIDDQRIDLTAERE